MPCGAEGEGEGKRDWEGEKIGRCIERETHNYTCVHARVAHSLAHRCRKGDKKGDARKG